MCEFHFENDVVLQDVKIAELRGEINELTTVLSNSGLDTNYFTCNKQLQETRAQLEIWLHSSWDFKYCSTMS